MFGESMLVALSGRVVLDPAAEMEAVAVLEGDMETAVYNTNGGVI
jgi:hypothetical protein